MPESASRGGKGKVPGSREGGVLSPGGVCSGGSAPRGVSSGGCGIPACTEADTPTPDVNKTNDRHV